MKVTKTFKIKDFKTILELIRVFWGTFIGIWFSEFGFRLFTTIVFLNCFNKEKLV